MKRLLLITFAFWASLSFCQTGKFIPSDNFSSGLIASLCQDKYGFIWIATDHGLNRYDGYHFQTYLHDDNNPWSLRVNATVSLFNDSKGRLWIGTTHGLERYDEAANGFVHYQFPDSLEPRISQILELSDGRIMLGTAGYGAFLVDKDDQITAATGFVPPSRNHYFSRMHEDSKHRFWVTGSDDIIVMKSGNKIQTFKTKGEPRGIVEREGEIFIASARCIATYHNGQFSDCDIDLGELTEKDVIISCISKDAHDNIYVGTRGHGLYFIAKGSRRLQRYDASIPGTSLGSTTIRSILADQSGNLWLGLQRKGLALIPQRPLQFSNWSFEAQKVSLGAPITSVCEGDAGLIWCTVQGVGVFGFDAKGHIIAHPTAPDAVEFIFRDRQKRYWIGTDDGLYAYDPLTGNSHLKVNFVCDKYNDMTSDNAGNIYISTFSRGMCIYNPETGELRNYRNTGGEPGKKGHLCNDWILSMTVDRNGLIWMGTASGVSSYDPRSDSFLSQGWNQLLTGVICLSICELNNNDVAIGTDNGLYLYNHKSRQVTLFPGSEQLCNKMVNYIVQSNDGDLWCSTSMGIWHYENDKKSFIGYVNGNGLVAKEYLIGVGMHTDNDRIYLGHNDGFTVFSPKDIKDRQPTPAPLLLSAFYVSNQMVNTLTELNGVHVTDQAVPENSYFTVSYLDHTITMAFSQLTYDNPENLTYEYRINNGKWIRNPEGKNDFTLSHLQPGSYRITVRALQGNLYTPEKVIVVTVRPPWYRSLLAYFIYAVLLLTLGLFIFRTYQRHANEQLNEEKMKFLINATHDIRSPLTLIMSPLAHLRRHSEGMADDARRDLDTIERNAQRILNLVNQILDVRKIDKQQLHLHCQPTDIVEFIQGIYKMFEYYAAERNISFIFDHQSLTTLQAWVDRSQFDKVITNLLSNAFKYTHEGGTIEIRLTADTQQMLLQITDSGDGIDDDTLRHIFDRFYQGRNARQLHTNGTGIGLHLCKMIVDMHHGSIEASNRTDGQTGACFKVSLPLGNAHLTPEEIEQPEPEKKNEKTADINTSTRTGNSGPRILVVDDDAEIGRYIATELGSHYRFTLSPNGREALQLLLADDYDLVISDVMMPEMDGFTLLRMIKTNLNLSHLPVIMLTSKADVANRLEGLERGADAFIAKPFVLEELHANIDNLLNNRRRLKGKYNSVQHTEKVDQIEVKGNDEILMERIVKAINKNLSDSEFNVDKLTVEVGISRAQLHRKMKELTGISTSEFLRNIRLEQAARLLREQKINVTQVAYSVGFSNLAHFSTVFRQHFGVAPSEYAEQQK